MEKAINWSEVRRNARAGAWSVRKIAHHAGIGIDDVVSIATLQVLEDWRPEKGEPGTLAYLIATRRVRDAARRRKVETRRFDEYRQFVAQQSRLSRFGDPCIACIGEVLSAVNSLSPTERAMIKLRYGLRNGTGHRPMTLYQMGQIYHKSPTVINTIITAIMLKLRLKLRGCPEN